MGKKVMFFFFLTYNGLLCVHLKSQDVFTKTILWESKRDAQLPVFNNRDEIKIWNKKQLPFSSIQMKDFSIRGINLIIVIVTGCSGLPCNNISVYKEQEDKWSYVTGATNIRFKDVIGVKADNKAKRIIFFVKEEEVGELFYEYLICQ